MKLNHVNLTVTDVPAAATFLEHCFGPRNKGENAGMGFLAEDVPGGLIVELGA